MHIPKLLAIISVVTLGAGSLSVHAQRPDSDMQAIAREQMRQALLKMDATNAPPVVATPKPVKKVVAPAPAQPTMVIVPTAPTPVAPPAVAVPPPTAPVRAVPPPVVAVPPPVKPAPPVQPPAVPEPVKPVAVAKPKAPSAKATEFSPFSPIAESPGTGNPPVTLVIPGENPVPSGNTLKRTDERKAREEVRKSLGETSPKANVDAKFPVEAKMGTDTGMTAHPTPAPGSKEDRLSELLEMYKADKISPAEYHAQRSKILAEP
jgi:hypothetical protein